MPIDPDNINAKGAKIDVTRLARQIRIKKGLGTPATEEEYARMAKLTQQLLPFEGSKAGVSARSIAKSKLAGMYQQWKKTPPTQSSNLARRLEPMPYYLHENVWWGSQSGIGRPNFLSPVRIADRAARDLVTGRITPRDLVEKAVKYYPRGDRFMGYDQQGNQIIKENAPWTLKALLAGKSNLPRVAKYAEDVLDSAPPQKGKPPTPIRPPAPRKPKVPKAPKTYSY